ncbi:hypothetical protein VT03_18660 [Planctomyces sp. SH-PL14]|nr:hypothetical protein VT03_18660 [Planctomyces sp. SH-PL14]
MECDVPGRLCISRFDIATTILRCLNGPGLEPRPRRHSSHSSNPTCDGSLGSRGSHPLAAGGLVLTEPWDTTDVPFVEPASRTRCSLCHPRGLMKGHTARCPRLDTCSFRHLSTRGPPAGKGTKKTTQAPLHSPPGCPWTRDTHSREVRSGESHFPCPWSLAASEVEADLRRTVPSARSHCSAPQSRHSPFAADGPDGGLRLGTADFV